MSVVARIDEFGRPAWIAVAVLGFCVWWPLGLATLAFALGSGRMAGGTGSGFGRWYNTEAGKGCGWRARRRSEEPAGGNRAFAEYREETLRRLEEEERAFREFLDRLRLAKDKAEFDQFMAERRAGGSGAASAG
jgi:hypothetical protein